MDIQRATQQTYPRAVLERAMQHYHCVVGGQLIADWKLPDGVTDAILHHHDYRAQARATETTMVVHLGDLLAEWMGAGHGEVRTCEEIAASPVLDDLSIYPDDFEQLLALKDSTVRRMAEVEG
jgi:HD-like signal output (HDOD) protein